MVWFIPHAYGFPLFRLKTTQKDEMTGEGLLCEGNRMNASESKDLHFE